MIQEIAHALIQRIFRDKILMGLIIIGMLAIFMSGMSTKDEPSGATHSSRAAEPVQQGAQPGQGQGQASGPGQSQGQPATLDPNLATDFVKWWLGLSMDYSATTAAQSHQQAFAWMSKEACASFQSIYWTPDTANGVADGRIVAVFHPTAIQAQAINPDGGVVVGVTGTYILQASGRPVPYDVKAAFLVKRAADGLRVAGVYNELASQPSSSVY